MRISAILTVIPLLALVGASPTPPKPTLANGAVRFKRQGGVCAPKSSSSSATATATESASATDSASVSDTASATASQSSAASPSESAIIGVNGTYPIQEVIDHGSRHADPAEGGGRRLRVAGRDDLCVTVQGGMHTSQSFVAISRCFSNTNSFANEQLWDLPTIGSSGQITLHNDSSLCLSPGERLDNCSSDSSPLQQWSWTTDGLLHVDNQCLAIDKDSQQSYQKPYISDRDLIAIACEPDSPYQQFGVYDGPDVSPPA